MASSDTTPRIVLGSVAKGRGTHPVLIVAGTATSDLPEGTTRVVTLQDSLEVGRGAQADVPDWGEDRLMSRSHARITRLPNGRHAIRDLDSTNGTWLNGQRLAPGVRRKLEDGAVIMTGSLVFVFRRITQEQLKAIEEEAREPFALTPTRSPAMALVVRRLRRFARTNVDLLLTGETGVGKEIHAEALHRASGRPGLFVTINCAAIPDNLLESELFGYARGAHSTAARPKAGLLEQAERGTIFLDELGEMPASSQSKLLRFLQSRQVLSLGSTQPRSLDVRVVAATQRGTTSSSGLRGVREDLAARLGPAPVTLPPLRDRIEDVGALAHHIGGRLRFEPEAYLSLYLHQWRGNVRELGKVLEVARAYAGPGEAVLREHLPPELAAHLGTAAIPEAVRRQRPSLEELHALLSRHHGRVARVARELGRQRTLVWRWLREHRLKPGEFRH
jgi:transcriptional regulator with PAS, ATPase and Fis domain